MVIAGEAQQVFVSQASTTSIKKGKTLLYSSVKFKRLVESMPTRTEDVEVFNAEYFPPLLHYISIYTLE